MLGRFFSGDLVERAKISSWFILSPVKVLLERVLLDKRGPPAARGSFFVLGGGGQGGGGILHGGKGPRG